MPPKYKDNDTPDKEPTPTLFASDRHNALNDETPSLFYFLNILFIVLTGLKWTKLILNEKYIPKTNNISINKNDIVSPINYMKNDLVFD